MSTQHKLKRSGPFGPNSYPSWFSVLWSAAIWSIIAIGHTTSTGRSLPVGWYFILYYLITAIAIDLLFNRRKKSSNELHATKKTVELDTTEGNQAVSVTLRFVDNYIQLHNLSVEKPVLLMTYGAARWSGRENKVLDRFNQIVLPSLQASLKEHDITICFSNIYGFFLWPKEMSSYLSNLGMKGNGCFLVVRGKIKKHIPLGSSPSEQDYIKGTKEIFSFIAGNPSNQLKS